MERMSQTGPFDDISFDDISLDDVNLEEVDLNPGGLDFTELSKAMDEEFNLDFDSFSDGEDFLIDFDSVVDLSESDDVELDLGGVAEVLKSYANVSTDLLSYYQYALNALQKLFASERNKSVKGVRPLITDFSYISPVERKQQVYGFFCQMLNDLARDPRYADFTAEEAYQEMLKEIYNDLYWTPNIHEEYFRRTFFAYFENNKKLAQASLSSSDGSVISLLDKGTLETSELVFRVNSIPFNVMSKFFGDVVNLPSPSLLFPNDCLGDFGNDLKSQYNVRTMTHQQVYDGIIVFLSSPETMRLLGLAEDDLDFTIGELFRRFLVKELNDGVFYPNNSFNLQGLNSLDEKIKVLARLLLDGMRQQSFAAEIMFFCIELMLRGDSGSYLEFLEPFVSGMLEYFVAFSKDSALVNPVFYTLIDKVDGDYEEPRFKITYTENNEVKVVETSGILCEVLGDSNTIYWIPLVYLGPDTKSAICPPKEIVDNIRTVTARGHLSITGSVRYRYVPSYRWLSGLNLTVAAKEEHVASSESITSQVNNPLLSVLLNYDNEFDYEGEEPEVISMKGNGIQSLLAVDMKREDSGIPIKYLCLENSTIVNSGVFIIDSSDDSIVLRYPNDGQEETLILSKEEYDLLVTEEENETHGSVNRFDLLGLDSSPIEESNFNPYFEGVIKRLCELTALDYEQELSDAREAIARDLANVLHVAFIDQILGYKMIQLFVDDIKATGALDVFNLQTLKEVVNFTVGRDNVLVDVEEFSMEVLESLESLLAEQSTMVSELLNQFERFDNHILALQSVSRGELPSSDIRVYNALHMIPSVHSKLRDLESRFILVKILNEIGSDIVPILMKNTTLNNVYRTRCTKENVGFIEKELASSMKKSGTECLRATKNVLYSSIPENAVILKYFVLERNPYGILTSLEDIISMGYEDFRDVYVEFKTALGFGFVESISSMTEENFKSSVNKGTIDSAFKSYEVSLLDIVYKGLIADAGHNLNLQVVKAYDIMSCFGTSLFSLGDSSLEDITDVSEFADDFYSYVGSFYVSYSPIHGEAEDEIDGGVDRFTAYIKHRSDFTTMNILQRLEKYDLVDLHKVEGADSSDVVESKEDSEEFEEVLF